MLYNYILPCIISAIFIIAFVVSMTLIFKNKKNKMLPIIVIWGLLCVFEVAKIFYLIHDNAEFRPLRYPFVFCSLVMYTYPLFIFKTNKLSQVAKTLSVIPSIVVFLLFVATQMNYGMSVIQAHSYFFHSAMIAVAIYMLTTKIYTPKLSDAFSMFLGLSLYIVFCIALSLFIGADISLFGPGSSYLSVIYNPFGYVPGNLILMIVLFILGFIIYGIIYLCTRKKKVEEVTLITTENVVNTEAQEEGVNNA